MNEGATHATGDILVFLHADTLLPPDAFSLIRSTVANKRYVGGAFTLRIHPQTQLFKMIAVYSTAPLADLPSTLWRPSDLFTQNLF